jgi:Fe-Mn family superoxide dismutase
MRYQLTPIHCRPWLLNGLSTRLIESHYENNYGATLRRLNAITEKLASLDFAKTPGYVINGLKREEVVALNSTLLHELYFASLGVAPVAKGRNSPGPRGRSPRRWRATSARLNVGVTSSSPWATPLQAAPGGCCSSTSRATGG